jgi:hypothetical protein
MSEIKELELENAFYASHKAEFHKKYFDKWLVIVGESLWNVFDKFSDAAQAAFQNFKPGDFMIHTPSHDDIVFKMGPLISETSSPDSPSEDLESGMTATEGELVKYNYAY